MPGARPFIALVVLLAATHAYADADACRNLDGKGTPFVVSGRSSMPSLAAADRGFVVFWTENPGDKWVRAERFTMRGQARASPQDTIAPLVMRARPRTVSKWTQAAAASSSDAFVVWIDDGELSRSTVSLDAPRAPSAARRVDAAVGGPFREVAMASTAAGDVAIVWHDGGAGSPVRARIERSDRIARVDQHAVDANDATSIDVGMGWIPDVAITPSGDRVIVAWTAHTAAFMRGERGPLPQVQWRLLDGKTGAPISDARPVAFDAAVEGHNAVVAAAPDGRFVVGWNTLRDRTKKGARVRVFDKNGAPLGAPIDVDDEAGDVPDAQQQSTVRARQIVADLEDITIARAPGGFAVSWLREHGGAGDVMVRWFDWDGKPRTRPLRVGTSALRFHQLAVTDDGHEIIVWAEQGHRMRGVVTARCR